MSGGTEIRLNPAIPDGAGSGRSLDGKGARSSEKSATPFESVLTRLAPGAGKAGSSEARPLGRFHKPDLREPRIASLTAPEDGADVGPAQAGATEVATLGPVPQGESLAQHVAERIAASLGQATAEAIDTSGEMTPQTGPSRSERALPARLALAMATTAKADTAAASSGATFSVTHRETHFGPVLAAAGAAVAVAAGESDAVARLADAGGSPSDTRPGSIRQGRAEQVMIAGRAAPERAAAPKSSETFVNAAGRPVAEEMKSGGPAQQASGEGARGLAFDGGAFGLTGGTDARAAGPASGVSATQPAAAPPALPAPASPVKVLHIQLHPAELGMLEVRMKLSDAGLELHIAATRHETLALLKSDQDALASVLRGAGHSLEAVSVSFSDKSGASGQQPQDGWQPPASGARPESQSGSPREQGGRFDDRSSSRPETRVAFDQVKDDQYQSVPVRPRGSLYL